MRSPIHFVTGNPHKAAELQQVLEPLGIPVLPTALDLVEPQASVIQVVAESKAEQAYAQVREAVVVEDSGFSVEALRGFPGPYVKYLLETIGIEGLLRLMEPFESRGCAFTSVMVYRDADGMQTFNAAYPGRLAREIDPTPSEMAWSELWRVFIPEGETRTLTAIPPKELRPTLRGWAEQSVYVQLARWLSQRSS